MKRKISKRLVAMALTITMLFSSGIVCSILYFSSPSSFAASGNTSVILVPDFLQTNLVDENGSKVFGDFDIDMAGLLNDNLASLVGSVIGQSYKPEYARQDRYEDDTDLTAVPEPTEEAESDGNVLETIKSVVFLLIKIRNIVNFLRSSEFSNLECNENGQPINDYIVDNKYRLETKTTKSLEKTYGKENVYTFNYDFRLDYCENGRNMANYINSVKEENPKNDIELIAYGTGGLVTLAYLSEYGSEGLDSITTVGTPYFGSDSAADIINSDDEAIIEYYSNTVGSISYNLMGSIDELLKFDFAPYINKLHLYMPSGLFTIGNVVGGILGTKLSDFSICDSLKRVTLELGDSFATMPAMLQSAPAGTLETKYESNFTDDVLTNAETILTDNNVNIVAGDCAIVDGVSSDGLVSVDSATCFNTNSDKTWVLDGNSHRDLIFEADIIELLCGIVSDDIKTTSDYQAVKINNFAVKDGPYDAEDTFERVTPESQGVPSSLVNELMVELTQPGDYNETRHVMVMRHDKVIAESSAYPYSSEDAQHVFSVSKIVTSTAAGLLLDDGYLKLTDKLVDFFPEFVPEKPDENASEKEKQNYQYLNEIIVEDLLAMTSGAEMNELQILTTKRYMEVYMNSGFDFKPGTSCDYNSANSYMLSAIINQIVKENNLAADMTEFVNMRVFEKIGILNFNWEKSYEGIEQGGFAAYLTAENVARILTLYKNGGVWNGEQIISAEYCEAATTYKIRMFDEYDDQYGYNWYTFWFTEDERIKYADGSKVIIPDGRLPYICVGMFGQYGIVWPEKDMVIVILSGNFSRNIEPAMRNILGANKDLITDGALPENEADYNELSATLNNMNFIAEVTERNSKIEKNIDEKMFETGFNGVSILPSVNQLMHKERSSGVEEIKFNFDESDVVALYWKEGGMQNTVDISMDGQKRVSKVKMKNTEYNVAAFGSWNDNTLYVQIRFLNTVSGVDIYFTFNEDGSVYIKENDMPSLTSVAKNMLSKSFSSLETESILEGVNKNIAFILRPVLNFFDLNGTLNQLVGDLIDILGIALEPETTAYNK